MKNTTFTGKIAGVLNLKIKAVLRIDRVDDVRLEDLEDPCERELWRRISAMCGRPEAFQSRLDFMTEIRFWD